MACKYIYDNIEYLSKDEFVKNVLIPKKAGGESFYKQILQLNKELSISKKSLIDFKREAKNINNGVLNEKIQNYENIVYQGEKIIDSLLNTLEYSMIGDKVNFSKSSPKYTKILFPTGNTASKVEGHTTLEGFRKQKEDRLSKLISDKQELEDIKSGKIKNEVGFGQTELNEELKQINNEINQLKQELERVEREGFGALRPIYNFYENTVTNILKKQGFNPVLITDEYGNTWNEITITPKYLDTIKFKSNKLEYTGDLAIEEKMAEMMENTPDENLPKSVIGKWIQSVRNFFRNLFKERDKLQRFMRDINQGRYANQKSIGVDSGKRYSQLSKQNYKTNDETIAKIESNRNRDIQELIRSNSSVYNRYAILADNDYIKAKLRGLTYTEKVKKLVEMGVLASFDQTGANTNNPNDISLGWTTNRPIVMVRFGDEVVPFYRSSKGNSGKESGRWYNFFGFGEDGWLIKADIATIKRYYDNPFWKKIGDLLTEVLDYDHELDKKKGQLKDFHPLFMNKELALSDKNVNYIVHGVDEYLPYDTKFNTFPYIKSLNKSMEEWSRFVKDNNIRQKITDYKTAEAAINSKYDRELENIKQNAQDLFETDVELADAVYEALGFKTLENNKLKQDVLEIIKDKENTPSFIFISFLLNNNLIPKIQKYITSTNSNKHGEWNGLYKRLTLDYSIRNTPSEKAKLISHELMHSLSHKYIVSYEALKRPDFKEYIEKVNENEKIKGTNRKIELVNLTAEQVESFDNLVRIKQKVFDFIKSGKYKETKKLKNADYGSLTYAFSELDEREDIHEFISEAFSNPILIDVLKQIPTENNKSNLFKDFINALKIILGFNNDSIIEDILHYSEEAFIKDAIKGSAQQKQQAYKIYNQYLEENPNGNIEGFKALVKEINSDRQIKGAYEFGASSNSNKWNRANNDLLNLVQNNNKALAYYTYLIGEVQTFKEIILFLSHYGLHIPYTDNMRIADEVMTLEERQSALESYNNSVKYRIESRVQMQNNILSENNLQDNTEYTPQELVTKFPLTGVQKVIWDLIKDVVNVLEIKVKFSSELRVSLDGSYDPQNGEILIRPFTLKNKRFGEVLVHEIVHALTTKIISRVNGGVTTGLTKKQISAVKGLMKLYEAVKKDNNLVNKYPVKDVFEFIAHLTNEEFVKELKTKDRTFLEKIIDFIRNILGIDNANELAKQYLKDIISDGVFLQEYGIVGTASDYNGGIQGSLSEFISNKSKNTNTSLSDVDKLFKDKPDINSILIDDVYEALGLNSIDESEISYTDDDGNSCASKGGRNSKFQKGGSWEIIKEFKGKPHSEGGINIEINKGAIKMTNKQGDFEAKFGLVISNNN